VDDLGRDDEKCNRRDACSTWRRGHGRDARATKALYLPARAVSLLCADRTGILRGMQTTRREFSVIIERDSAGYYVALVPELKGCHTQAKSLDTLMKRVREAIELCLEVEGDRAGMPEFVGVQRIAV
jgi:predicted RNase H-like HicB family nuclease